MSYELRAIIEYDAARIEIIGLTKKISDSMSFFNGDFFVDSCSCRDGNCVDRLYTWRREMKQYIDHRCYEEEDHACPDHPEGEEPTLCDAGKIVDEIVQQRKEAKKRFGIAKTRLSRIARDYRNSTVLSVDEI